MKSLEEWKDAKELTTADEVLFVFPCLKELIISQCNKLRCLPDSLGTCVYLEKLAVQDCPNLAGVSSITSYGIKDPLSRLQCVEYIENGDCLPSSSTSSSHPSLQKLNLCDTAVLDGISYSIVMEVSLEPYSPPLLDQNQYFIALKILWIQRSFEMVALPEGLGNLSSLQQLYIVDCNRLVHLPSKEAMRRLTQLKTLIIYGCPKFEDNEQIKISHVPCVEINKR